MFRSSTVEIIWQREKKSSDENKLHTQTHVAIENAHAHICAVHRKIKELQFRTTMMFNVLRDVKLRKQKK